MPVDHHTVRVEKVFVHLSVENENVGDDWMDVLGEQFEETRLRKTRGCASAN